MLPYDTETSINAARRQHVRFPADMTIKDNAIVHSLQCNAVSPNKSASLNAGSDQPAPNIKSLG
jgi:hypothetical protein